MLGKNNEEPTETLCESMLSLVGRSERLRARVGQLLVRARAWRRTTLLGGHLETEVEKWMENTQAALLPPEIRAALEGRAGDDDDDDAGGGVLAERADARRPTTVVSRY